MIKVVYIPTPDYCKVAWIVCGVINNYPEMARVLSSMTDEEIQIFDNYFKF